MHANFGWGGQKDGYYTFNAFYTDPWEYYWVGFNGACANKLVQQTPFSDVQPVHHCKDPQSTRLETIYNIYLARGPEPQCEALMTGYLYLFMAQLMKEAARSHAQHAVFQQPVCAGRYQVYSVQLFP